MSDESRNLRREEALARRLGKALDQISQPGTEPCPDAEQIAAFHQHELEPEEIAQCEAHFAGCSRCRKILAVLAASDDTPLAEKEVARLGELVAAAQVSHVATARPATIIRPKRPEWRVRWLAPALGVAAVLAVWFAMRPPWRTMDQGSSGTLVAQGPKNEPLPPAEAPPTQALQPNSATPPAAQKDQAATKTEIPEPSPEAFAKKSGVEGRAVGGRAGTDRVPESAPAKEKKESAGLNAPVPAAPPPPQVAAPARNQPAQARSGAAGQGAPSAPEPPGSVSQSVTVTGEAQVVASAGAAASSAPARDRQAFSGQDKISDLPVNGRNFQALSKLDAVRESAIQIKSPSGKIFWRVGRVGHIERSTNGGGAWILQASPSTEEWLSGAAASDKVCWIVGHNGAIARTTDGEHWEEIASPSMSADASGRFPDWINVTASDAQTATITAGDQRRFSTQDGGKTWRAQ